MVALDASLIVPVIAGFRLAMSNTFSGNAGQAVDQAQWNIITNVHYNNEVQDYTTSTDNLHFSGNNTLLIVPLKSADGKWTSARIESKDTFTPEDGKVTRFQSTLRFGDSPKNVQQGIWPAFWMLGDSSRHGTPWPQCGELDIMERINGDATGHGTPHCGTGDPCGAATKEVPLPDNGWHTWTIDVDRKDKDWTKQSVTWMLDGKKYNTFTGADAKDEGTWKSVGQSPLYFILNVAVGGDWPGAPNAQTVDGLKSMMEVKYVAAYTST